ncbi:phage integrase central domain-containing protein [Pseudomonas sp. DCB_E]|uniref:phage integrase central domain-containing protein n=1 Tax=Pseudomonas sp. DCB_E TaxID=2993591 RepID=UPI003A4E1533
MEILGRVVARDATTVALLVRQWSSAVFRYVVATLRADADPAAALNGTIHRPKVQHLMLLTREQIADFSKMLE